MQRFDQRLVLIIGDVHIALEINQPVIVFAFKPMIFRMRRTGAGFRRLRGVETGIIITVFPGGDNPVEVLPCAVGS